MLESIKRAMSPRGVLSALICGLARTPVNPVTAMPDEGAPRGLKLLYVARTISEADLLRQVLTDAGFQLEYVAASSTGVFGTTGNASIYIHPDQFEEAEKFLHEYFAADSASVE